MRAHTHTQSIVSIQKKMSGKGTNEYCARKHLLMFLKISISHIHQICNYLGVCHISITRSKSHNLLKSLSPATYLLRHYSVFTPIFVSVAITHQVRPAFFFVWRGQKMSTHVEIYISVPEKNWKKTQDKTNLTWKILVSNRSDTLVHILLCIDTLVHESDWHRVKKWQKHWNETRCSDVMHKYHRGRRK